MRFKRMIHLSGICVIFTIAISIFGGGDAQGQAALEIDYTNLQMSCGGSQNLSASGGCPPYTWSLSGGGTLTPSGGDNTNATYVAPGNNANCTDNPTIILTDCNRNIAGIWIAVNCVNEYEAMKRGEVQIFPKD